MAFLSEETFPLQLQATRFRRFTRTDVHYAENVNSDLNRMPSKQGTGIKCGGRGGNCAAEK